MVYRTDTITASNWQKMYRTLPSAAVSKLLFTNPFEMIDLTIPTGNWAPSSTTHHYKIALHSK